MLPRLQAEEELDQFDLGMLSSGNAKPDDVKGWLAQRKRVLAPRIKKPLSSISQIRAAGIKVVEHDKEKDG